MADPGMNNLTQFPRYEGDYSNAVRQDLGMQPHTDCAANQNIQLHLCEMKRCLHRWAIRKVFVCFPDDFSRLGFNDPQQGCRIKNRCNSVVPVRKGCHHGQNSLIQRSGTIQRKCGANLVLP